MNNGKRDNGKKVSEKVFFFFGYIHMGEFSHACKYRTAAYDIYILEKLISHVTQCENGNKEPFIVIKMEKSSIFWNRKTNLNNL